MKKVFIPDVYFRCEKCSKLFKKDYDFIKAVKNDIAIITCDCGNEFKIKLVKSERSKNDLQIPKTAD